MGRTSFVAWLYIMAGACVLIALGDRAWGWLMGAIIFFAVADLARRQLKKEVEAGPAPPRFAFVGLAMLVMLVVMFFLFWIQMRA
jgi:hypothetical protein